MERIRQIALAVSLIAIGLGAGHFVQKDIPPPQAALPDVSPSSVVPLAAGPEEVLLPLPAPLTALPPVSSPLTAIAPPADIADCGVHIDLLPRDHAMVTMTVIAPCHPDERVVIKHAGLAVTERTSPNGVLFVDIPAMELQAEITAVFGNGEIAQAQITVPDAARIQRFAVQWLDEDGFQINAFTNAASYGEPGHVSAVNPHRPGSGSGFLTVLGNGSVDLPMLAEVYTYPEAGKTEVVVEAEVTEATCGREMLGETILSSRGAIEVQELTLAMPDCLAMGDILVLKNLAPDTKLANR
ncbi:MAG: hypothetical protein A2092_06200 [Rhodobacteraceae bacterium GWE1_64_9]|nr:MAG: hypothetical protein A2092_06200 [Rhodobacteraceae bacterium GWE1_64_9]OHC50086.1 MAG: hypothetical protein A2X69_00010 [Rhodobacteraceae bacterium GWF1_65_7]HBD91449.1 hypothetical protein [Gemmobacter sp.]